MNSRHINWMTATGIGILTIFLIMSVFAPILSPYDPSQLGIPFQKPTAAHFLGTNDLGQDILSELIYASRVSLLIGLLSAVLITIIGASLGIIAGYIGGKTDAIIMWITNVALLIPSLPLTIILVAYLRGGLINIVIAICITSWATTARIVRSRVMQIRRMPYVEMEENMGVGKIRIMLTHILPNVTDIVFIRGVMSASNAMLTEAGLSFMGIGVITQKSWGNILHYAFYRNGVLNGYIWWYLPPILCICLCIMGFVLIGYANGASFPLFRKRVIKS